MAPGERPTTGDPAPRADRGTRSDSHVVRSRRLLHCCRAGIEAGLENVIDVDAEPVNLIDVRRGPYGMGVFSRRSPAAPCDGAGMKKHIAKPSSRTLFAVGVAGLLLALA